MQVHPDAQIIQIHRDPLEVVGSFPVMPTWFVPLLTNYLILT